MVMNGFLGTLLGRDRHAHPR